MKQLFKNIIISTIVTISIGIFIFSDCRNTTIIRDNQHTIDSLHQHINHDRDTINILRLEASAERFKADSLQSRVNLLENKESVLKHKLDSILGTIDSIPVGENYTYLKDTAYNVIGDGEYPFNDNQLKLIRKDYEISKASYNIIAIKDSAIVNHKRII